MYKIIQRGTYLLPSPLDNQVIFRDGGHVLPSLVLWLWELVPEAVLLFVKEPRDVDCFVE